MTRTATPIKAEDRTGAHVRRAVLYAVGCTPAGDADAVVLGHVPTIAQASEAAEMLVRRRLRASGHLGDAVAGGVALWDLQTDGPQPEGWATVVDGCEIWYRPIVATVPDGMASGEMALLATLHESSAGFAAASS